MRTAVYRLDAHIIDGQTRGLTRESEEAGHSQDIAVLERCLTDLSIERRGQHCTGAWDIDGQQSTLDIRDFYLALRRGREEAHAQRENHQSLDPEDGWPGRNASARIFRSIVHGAQAYRVGVRDGNPTLTRVELTLSISPKVHVRQHKYLRVNRNKGPAENPASTLICDKAEKGKLDSCFRGSRSIS